MSEAILKKYLPDTTILIVDHHALDNNYNEFYNGGRVHFEDKKVVLYCIDSINLTHSYKEHSSDQFVESFTVEPLGESYLGEAPL